MSGLIFIVSVYLTHGSRNQAATHTDFTSTFTCLRGQGEFGFWNTLETMAARDIVSCQVKCQTTPRCIALDFATFASHGGDTCRLYAANKPRIGDPGDNQREYCVMNENLQDGGMDEADKLCAWLNSEVFDKSWYDAQSWKEVQDSDQAVSVYCKPQGEAWDMERWYWIYAETRKGHITRGDWRRYTAVKVERTTLTSQLSKDKASIDVTLHPSWCSQSQKLEQSTYVMTIDYDSKQSIKLKTDHGEKELTFHPPSTA